MGLFNSLKRLWTSEDIGRRQIAAQWLAGDGIEIGALHNPLRVPKTARVSYVDRMTLAELRKEYPHLAKKRMVKPSIIDNGGELKSVANESQDFVIANHMIEHTENPIAAMETFLRVLKPGGVLYLAIPDKRFTFDVDRKITKLDHLLRDYREGPAWSRKEHYEEYVRCVEKITDPKQHAERVKAMIATNENIHYHCWSQPEMWQWLNALQQQLFFAFDIEFYLHREYEGIFIIRKHRLAKQQAPAKPSKKVA